MKKIKFSAASLTTAIFVMAAAGLAGNGEKARPLIYLTVAATIISSLVWSRLR